jgi:tetratricopeptide (TPR) repeat protein
MGIQIIGLAVIALSILSVISPAMPLALAQNTTNVGNAALQQANASNSTAYQVLLAKANALYHMLSRCLALNISEDLRNKIEQLLSVNISALSVEELRVWVNNASRLLARVSEEVRVGGRAYAIGIVLERYLNGIKKALEAKIKAFEKKFGVNATGALANITSAKDFKELGKVLKRFEKDIWIPAKLQRFANITLNVTAVTALRSVAGIKIASKHLDVAEKVLNRTIVMLRGINASEEAITALLLAVEKIRETREIVLSTSKQIITEYNLTEVIKRIIENKTAEALEEIEELEKELQNLKTIALEKNLTKLVEDIDLTLRKLEELKSRITNATVENLAKWMRELAEIKAWIKFIKMKLWEMPVLIPGKGVDEAFNKTIMKASDMLSKVKEMLSYVENASSKLMCIAIYPPPPICNKAYLERIRLMVSKAEEILQKAQKLYEQSKKIEALITANKAFALLQVAKAWLEPLYNTLKQKEKSMQTAVTGLEVETRLQRGKGTGYKYTLTIRVRNTGNITVTIEKAIIVTQAAKSLEIGINTAVEPGKEITITRSIVAPLIIVGKPMLELQTLIGTVTVEVEVD